MDDSIVIFGMGKRLLQFGKYIDWNRVSFIVDNDANNLHHKYREKLVLPVSALEESEFSKVVIFSSKYFEQMYTQLISINIPAEKIVNWTDFIQYDDSMDIALKITDVLNRLKSRYVLDQGDFFSRVAPIGCIQEFEIDSREKADLRYDTVLLIDEYKNISMQELCDRIRKALIESGRVIFNLPYQYSGKYKRWSSISFSEFGSFHIIPCIMNELLIIERKIEYEPENKKIYVVTHKKCDIPKNGIYTPIWAGNGINEDQIADDKQGENISDLNPLINECTAIYWIWKHSEADIIGVNHYRRFFLKNNVFLDKNNILDAHSVNELMCSYDMVLAEPHIFTDETIREQLKSSTGNEAFLLGYDLITSSINKNQPDYMEVFEQVMDGHMLFPYNMLITRKEILDRYCAWLFSIILEPARNIDVSAFDPYSKRILGFFAERMMTVWLIKNPMKVKTLPVLQTI